MAVTYLCLEDLEGNCKDAEISVWLEKFSYLTSTLCEKNDCLQAYIKTIFNPITIKKLDKNTINPFNFAASKFCAFKGSKIALNICFLLAVLIC